MFGEGSGPKLFHRSAQKKLKNTQTEKLPLEKTQLPPSPEGTAMTQTTWTDLIGRACQWSITRPHRLHMVLYLLVVCRLYVVLANVTTYLHTKYYCPLEEVASRNSNLTNVVSAVDPFLD